MKILYLGLDPSRFAHQGELIHLPIIYTVAKQFEQVHSYFQQLPAYTHVLFTSRTPLSIYVEYSLKAGYLFSLLEKKHYLAIGRATAEALIQAGLKVNAVAEEERAEGVISLLEKIDFRNNHLFFPRSSLGRSLIPIYLKENKITTTLLDLYDTLPRKVKLPPLDSFDQIVLTSPTAVRSFFEQVDQPLSFDQFFCIGPITQSAFAKAFSIHTAECF